MSEIKWFLLLLAVGFLILLFRYIQLKKQIRNLFRSGEGMESWKFRTDDRHFPDG